MNYFFGINNDIFKSEIQIPLFQNRNFEKSNLKLFKTFPKNNEWVIQEISNKKINDYFYLLKSNDISSNEIFFLADDKVLDEFNKKKLINFNNFTDTSPSYRANLKIYLNKGGFSSYQSEYPFSMVGKRGTILSSISSIANSEADKNYVIIRNIFEEPIYDDFIAYLVNYNTKTVEDKFYVKTNYANCIEIKHKYIKPEIFLVTDQYLGIPIIASVKNDFLSLEHTLSPHEYILSENKFSKVSNLKKEINEIIG